jgi:hypothetical protein
MPLRTERDEGDDTAEAEPTPEADTVVTVAGSLVTPVLASVVAVLAARAGFSVERLSEAQLVTDAIAAHAAAAYPGRHVQVGIDAGERRLDLRLGPLVPGGATALVQSSGVAGLRPVLEQLTDELDIQSADGHEELRLAITDSR